MAINPSQYPLGTIFIDGEGKKLTYTSRNGNKTYPHTLTEPDGYERTYTSTGSRYETRTHWTDLVSAYSTPVDDSTKILKSLDASISEVVINGKKYKRVNSWVEV